MSLLDVLRAAADGRPPEPDGTVDVLPQHGRAAGVVAFSAHFVVCADVDHTWVRDQLPPGDFNAPLGARFLVALADRIAADVGSIDVVLVAQGTGGPPDDSLEEISAREHPRVVRALRYRDEVRVWRTHRRCRSSCWSGRGLAGRWETAFEVDPEVRGRGLGRRLAAAATGLVPFGEHVWAQVAPGNAASLRAVLAAGYHPVCAEVLLPPGARQLRFTPAAEDDPRDGLDVTVEVVEPAVDGVEALIDRVEALVHRVEALRPPRRSAGPPRRSADRPRRSAHPSRPAVPRTSRPSSTRAR